jgi:hypothetical protein
MRSGPVVLIAWTGRDRKRPLAISKHYCSVFLEGVKGNQRDISITVKDLLPMIRKKKLSRL